MMEALLSSSRLIPEGAGGREAMARVCSLVDAAVNCWKKSKGVTIRVDGLPVVTDSERETNVGLFEEEEASSYAMLLRPITPYDDD
jgi:hypothetical protein